MSDRAASDAITHVWGLTEAQWHARVQSAEARAERAEALVRQLGAELTRLAELDDYHGKNRVGADSHEQHIFDTEHTIARSVRESAALAAYHQFPGEGSGE